MHQPIPTQPLQTSVARLADLQASLLEDACRKVEDGRIDEALLLMDKAQELVWEPRVEILRRQLRAVRHPLPARTIESVRRAEEASRYGNNMLARMCLHAALERDPENPAVCRAAATVYENIGCIDDAARCRKRSQDLEIERGLRNLIDVGGKSEIDAQVVSGPMLHESAGPVKVGTGAPVYLVKVGGTMSHQDWAGQRGFWIRYDQARVQREG